MIETAIEQYYAGESRETLTAVLEAIGLARNNEKKVASIVINAFTEPFVIKKELFGMVEEMESSLKEEKK